MTDEKKAGNNQPTAAESMRVYLDQLGSFFAEIMGSPNPQHTESYLIDSLTSLGESAFQAATELHGEISRNFGLDAIGEIRIATDAKYLDRKYVKPGDLNAMIEQTKIWHGRLVALELMGRNEKAAEPTTKKKGRGRPRDHDHDLWQTRHDDWKRANQSSNQTQAEWAAENQLNFADVKAGFAALRSSRPKKSAENSDQKQS